LQESAEEQTTQTAPVQQHCTQSIDYLYWTTRKYDKTYSCTALN